MLVAILQQPAILIVSIKVKKENIQVEGTPSTCIYLTNSKNNTSIPSLFKE